MSRVLYGNLDLAGNQILNVLLQSLGSDPPSSEAKIYYNSTSKQIRYFDGTSWKALGEAGAGGPPSGGIVAGDLTGSSYPSPVIANGVVTDAKVATANKDGATGTYSMRTLGTGAQQAAAGNDTRFTDSRNPTGTAGGDLAGTYPNPTLKPSNIDDADINTISTAKITNLDTTLTGKLNTVSPTVTAGDLTLANATPTAASHAASKQYVDLTAQGLDFKNSVKVATTANITLTNTQTIDGIGVIAGDRVLVKDQSTASENGIYTVAAGAWVRGTDADANGEISDGSLVPVEQGTAQADSLFICTATGATPWVPGSSTSTWTRFGSVTTAAAGAGLVYNAGALDLVSATGDMTVGADNVTINSAPKWSTGRTITLGTDLTGNVTLDGSANVTLNATLAAGAGGKRFAAALTASTSQVVTHNLNTRDVHVTVYNSGSPYEQIDVEVQHTTVNTVTILANPALPAGYRAVVLG